MKTKRHKKTILKSKHPSMIHKAIPPPPSNSSYRSQTHLGVLSGRMSAAEQPSSPREDDNSPEGNNLQGNEEDSELKLKCDTFVKLTGEFLDSCTQKQLPVVLDAVATLLVSRYPRESPEEQRPTASSGLRDVRPRQPNISQQHAQVLLPRPQYQPSAMYPPYNPYQQNNQHTPPYAQCPPSIAYRPSYQYRPTAQYQQSNQRQAYAHNQQTAQGQPIQYQQAANPNVKRSKKQPPQKQSPNTGNVQPKVPTHIITRSLPPQTPGPSFVPVPSYGTPCEYRGAYRAIANPTIITHEWLVKAPEPSSRAITAPNTSASPSGSRDNSELNFLRTQKRKRETAEAQATGGEETNKGSLLPTPPMSPGLQQIDEQVMNQMVPFNQLPMISTYIPSYGNIHQNEYNLNQQAAAVSQDQLHRIRTFHTQYYHAQPQRWASPQMNQETVRHIAVRTPLIAESPIQEYIMYDHAEGGRAPSRAAMVAHHPPQQYRWQQLQPRPGQVPDRPMSTRPPITARQPMDNGVGMPTNSGNQKRQIQPTASQYPQQSALGQLAKRVAMPAQEPRDNNNVGDVVLESGNQQLQIQPTTSQYAQQAAMSQSAMRVVRRNQNQRDNNNNGDVVMDHDNQQQEIQPPDNQYPQDVEMSQLAETVPMTAQHPREEVQQIDEEYYETESEPQLNSRRDIFYQLRRMIDQEPSNQKEPNRQRVSKNVGRPVTAGGSSGVQAEPLDPRLEKLRSHFGNRLVLNEALERHLASTKRTSAPAKTKDMPIKPEPKHPPTPKQQEIVRYTNQPGPSTSRNSQGDTMQMKKLMKIRFKPQTLEQAAREEKKQRKVNGDEEFLTASEIQRAKLRPRKPVVGRSVYYETTDDEAANRIFVRKPSPKKSKPRSPRKKPRPKEKVKKSRKPDVKVNSTQTLITETRSTGTQSQTPINETPLDSIFEDISDPESEKELRVAISDEEVDLYEKDKEDQLYEEDMEEIELFEEEPEDVGPSNQQEKPQAGGPQNKRLLSKTSYYSSQAEKK